MRVLVAFYSRSGHTRQAAEAVIEVLRGRGVEAELEEILDRRRRGGVLGWLGAGRDAMLGTGTAIAPPRLAADGFDAVAVGTPVWAWTAAPAALAYCRSAAGRAKRAGFFCTMGSSGAERAFLAMNTAMGEEPAAKLALTARQLRDAAGLTARAGEFAEALTG